MHGKMCESKCDLRCTRPDGCKGQGRSGGGLDVVGVEDVVGIALVILLRLGRGVVFPVAVSHKLGEG